MKNNTNNIILTLLLTILFFKNDSNLDSLDDAGVARTRWTLGLELRKVGRDWFHGRI